MKIPSLEPPKRAILFGVGALALLSLPLRAQTAPHRPQPRAITGVRFSSAEGAEAHTLLLRAGRIEAVLEADAELPPGVRVIDGDGLIATPALIDAFSTAGCDAPEAVVTRDLAPDTSADVMTDMREANRKGIRPAFAAARVFALDDAGAGAYRSEGFGMFVSAPSGELLGGTSALVSTREAAARDQIVRGEVFDHAAFDASGPGYPSTLMGYIAQLRQFFLDAQRHGVLADRMRAGRPGPRPAYDEDLDAGLVLLDGERRLLCEADNARDIRRWMRLADEFGLSIAISGGAEAYKVSEALAARGIPVVLTLDWGKEVEDPDAKKEGKAKRGEGASEGSEPKPEAADSTTREPVLADPDAPQAEPATEETSAASEPEAQKAPESKDAESKDAKDDWLYEEPLEVRREKRRLWEEHRDCALRLNEAGVRFAFASGKEGAKDLREHVAQLVEAGLPADVALEALTRVPAEWLGVAGHYGRLEPGYAANIALWTDSPTAKGAQLAHLVVDGFAYEFEVKEKAAGGAGEAPAEGVDLSGKWVVETDTEDEEEPATLELEMAEDGTVTGHLSFKSPIDDAAMRESIGGRVSGRDVTLEASFTLSNFQIDLKFVGTVGGDGTSFNGERTVKGPGFEETDDFAARHAPERRGRTSLGTKLAELLATGEAQRQRSGTGAEAGAPLELPTGRVEVESRCGCYELGQGHSHDDDDEEDHR